MSRDLDISPEEVKRRIDTVSMLRETTRKLRQAALEAYERGEFPYKPQYDIRTDMEYWRRRAREHGYDIPDSTPASDPSNQSD